MGSCAFINARKDFISFLLRFLWLWYLTGMCCFFFFSPSPSSGTKFRKYLKVNSRLRSRLRIIWFPSHCPSRIAVGRGLVRSDSGDCGSDPLVCGCGWWGVSSYAPREGPPILGGPRLCFEVMWKDRELRDAVPRSAQSLVLPALGLSLPRHGGHGWVVWNSPSLRPQGWPRAWTCIRGHGSERWQWFKGTRWISY